MTLLAWERSTEARPATVALLHGWGQDASAWAAWHAPLADAGLAVVACDLPGHRGSGEFSAPRGVDLARWAAQAVSRDLDTLGAGDAHVVGFAEGGMVAAHLAVEGRAGRVALVAPALDFPPHHAAEAAAALRDPTARLWSQEASELVAKARAGGHDREVLADWLERASWPGPARLRAITASVLVAAGSTDPQRHMAPKLAAVLGYGRLTTVPGAGEALLDSPLVRATVVDFLTEAR